MHSSASSTFVPFACALGLLLTGCPPTTAVCSTGLVLDSDGRCVAAPDGGPGGDGSVSDTGVRMIDAGTGPDGCALHTYYADTDGDGHGNPSATMFACEMPTGYVTTADDCDDTCASCHPGATEICEGTHDENCDGHVDEASACSCTTGASQPCGMSSTAPCHMGTQTCTAGAWSACTGNVDPTTEVCNGIDDDCDGTVDDGLTIPLWYVDADGDGHGALGAPMMACTMPSGYVASGDDCNDASAAQHPGATEICDGLDNDCNGTADDGSSFTCVLSTATTCTTSCGTMGTGLCSATCMAPTGTACTPPPETCNGLDENCDGVADDGLAILGAPLTAIAAGATTATTFQGTHIVPNGTGYMVFGQTRESPTHITMQPIQASGTAMGGPVPLDVRIVPGTSAPFSVRAAGSNFLIGWGYLGVAATGTIMLASVNASGGIAMAPGTLTLPAGSAGFTRVIIADATMTTATVYATLRSVTTPVTYSIRRYGVNISSGAAGPSVTSATDVVTNLGAGDVFGVVSTSTGDYVAYVDTANNLKLAFAPSGGGAVTLFTTTIATGATGVAIAIGNPSFATGVGAANPLAIAWQDSTSEHFVEVRGLTGTTLTPGTSIAMTGGTGRSILFASPLWIDIVAVPNASSGTHSGHWFVAASDYVSTTTSAERAWEVFGGAGAPTAPAFTITSPVGAAGDLSIAVGAGGLRMAQATNASAIVTRQIGCR